MQNPEAARRKRNRRTCIVYVVVIVSILCVISMIFMPSSEESAATQTAEAESANAIARLTLTAHAITRQVEEAAAQTAEAATLDAQVAVWQTEAAPSPTRARRPTSTAHATRTDAPAAARPTSIRRPSKTPQPTTPPDSSLDGLLPAQVYEPLKERGFDCAGPTDFGGVAVWSCRKSQGGVILRADLYSNRLALDFIEAAAIGTSDSAAADFFALLAGWVNADAGQWARENSSGGATIIGGISMQITGAAGARTLEIGRMP